MIAVLAAGVVLSGPQLTRLANGIPIIVETTTDPLIAISVLIRTDDLPPLEMGAVQILSGALFGETQNFSLRQLENLTWESGGGISSIFAGDSIRLQLTTTKDRLLPTTSLLNETLRNPTFDEAELGRAIAANRRYQRWLDETIPLREISLSLAKIGLAPSPITEMTVTQAAALHGKVFRPNNISIAAVGPVDPEALANAFGGTLGHWNPQPPKPIKPFHEEMHRPNASFDTALMTVQGPSPKDQKFGAWLVACATIAEGKRSLLNRIYRVERGVSYLLGQVINIRKGISYATFFVSTSGKRPQDLSETVLRANISDQEVARAKALVAGRHVVGGLGELGFPESFSVDHRSLPRRAFWLAWWEMQGASVSRDRDLLKEIESVTTADVLAAAKKWFANPLKSS
jgi:predicted Zn-dependent peptidase